MTNEHKNKIYILMVDDDDDDIFIMQRELKRAGISKEAFQAFHGGQELLSYLASKDISQCTLKPVILLDINMPKMNGFEVLQSLQQSGINIENTPVVMFSTSSQPTDISKSKELGATDYLVKPRELSEFRQTIERIQEIALSKGA